ncbi:hypothetical protein Tco_1024380 [Tanacetum coccineum]
MAWRHIRVRHTRSPSYDGFSASDVATLTSQSIDINPYLPDYFFMLGLATTWEFPGFLPVFKDTEGNVVHDVPELSQFPFWMVSTIGSGREGGQIFFILKLCRIRERRSPSGRKKAEPKEKAADGFTLRVVAPNPSVQLKDVNDVETVESRKDEHVSIPRHDSAYTSIHNYAKDHDESFNERSPLRACVSVLVLFTLPKWTITGGLGGLTPEEWLDAVLPRCHGFLNCVLSSRFDLKHLYDAPLALKERCHDIASPRESMSVVRGERNWLMAERERRRERDELRAVMLTKASNIKELVLEAELYYEGFRFGLFWTGYPKRGLLLRMKGFVDVRLKILYAVKRSGGLFIGKASGFGPGQHVTQLARPNLDPPLQDACHVYVPDEKGRKQVMNFNPL